MERSKIFLSNDFPTTNKAPAFGASESYGYNMQNKEQYLLKNSLTGGRSKDLSNDALIIF